MKKIKDILVVFAIIASLATITCIVLTGIFMIAVLENKAKDK